MDGESPFVGVGRRVAGGSGGHSGPYSLGHGGRGSQQRAEPDDFLADLLANPAHREIRAPLADRLDAALLNWIKSRSAWSPRRIARFGPRAYVAQMADALAVGARLPVTTTARELMENHVAWDDRFRALRRPGDIDARLPELERLEWLQQNIEQATDLYPGLWDDVRGLIRDHWRYAFASGESHYAVRTTTNLCNRLLRFGPGDLISGEIHKRSLPHDIVSRHTLTWMLWRQGRRDEAVTELVALQAMDPDNAHIRRFSPGQPFVPRPTAPGCCWSREGMHRTGWIELR